MADYKSNAFTMYTEHVFKLKKHPTIAPKDGITAEEVKELCAYAKRYHVEVIGNFQSFGEFSDGLLGNQAGNGEGCRCSQSSD